MDGDQVIGYALSMTVNFSSHLSVLAPMFEMIKNLEYQGTLLNEKKYFIMGQVCVYVAYRGSGVFQALYQHMKQCYSQHYNYIITEIDQRNTRSTTAHRKVGFKILHQYSADSDSQNLGIDWDLVIWDWT
jgi:L-amino acid N-acyltransferase YncA